METQARLLWYVNRLKAMAPAEVLYRLQLKVKEPLVRRKISSLSLPHSLADILTDADTSIGWLPIVSTASLISEKFMAEIIQQADDVCDHRIRLFGNSFNLGDEIDWYKDYAHDVNCPRIDYAKINYRIPSQTGDIMYIWWLNRHQHLMPAAIAYYLTGDSHYSDEVLGQLESWLGECPYPIGPAWLTGIEVGIRLLTWSWLFRFLFATGKPPNCSDSFLVSWLLSIQQHTEYIHSHPARFSSANNHAIAETVGVMAAAVTWPSLFEHKNYPAHCCRKLVKEAERQVSHDGVYQEQSTSYHAFALELMLNACMLDEPTREELGPVIGSMADFLNALLGDNDIPPDFCDADNAVASGILPRSPQYYRQVVTAALTLSGEHENEKISQLSSPVHWYTGMTCAPDVKPENGDFSDGGYIVWKGKMSDGIKLQICMDTGPLGYGSLAAHGHADALSFTLDVNNEPVFIDPGTYAYHDEPVWRDYFRSTRAHNTLVLDGENQAAIRGPFLWDNKYDAYARHVVMSEDQFDVVAEHNGYRRQGKHVVHRRRISCHPISKKWDINEEFLGNGSWQIDLLFHIHPDREVLQQEGNRFLITGTDYQITLKLSKHLRARIARGETDPPLGWYSPVIGTKIPCPVIVGSGTVIGSDNLFTEFSVTAL
jgi:hypothetical protein